LLAIVMFDSSSAYNPLLWAASICRTFFQYSGLVILFCLLAWLLSKIVTSFHETLLAPYLFNAVFIYLLMIEAHLLGRFYFKNSEKLNWEV
jgi:hypothetical protein